MEIKIGKTSGFCYGVSNAVENSEKQLQNENEDIYCLGELVHNKTVMKDLESKGLKIIENINQSNGKTIIRAHGIKKEIYEKAKRKNIELIDLTCPNVLKIHNIVEEYAKKNYYIFLIGKKEHPEIIGTYSFCGKHTVIIQNIEEVEKAIRYFKKSEFKKILIISQTTYNLKVFEEIINEIKEKLPNNIHIDVKNTICLATELRQKETEEISKEVDLMIIVGGKNSSNTNKLYDISCMNCKNVIFVESEKDIEKDKISKFKKIGIMAGASTPRKSVDEIVKLLKKGEEIYA